MKRSGWGACWDGCIGGSAGGHHPQCPSAPSEPDHAEGCGPDCPGYFEGEPDPALGGDFGTECDCLCHAEPDDE